MADPNTAPDENQIIAERRAKLAELRRHGNAFPNDFARTHLADDPSLRVDLLFGNRGEADVIFREALAKLEANQPAQEKLPEIVSLPAPPVYTPPPSLAVKRSTVSNAPSVTGKTREVETLDPT